MKELKYKKGILVKVISWENDGDNYRTKEHIVDTIEEAQAIKRMCGKMFKSSWRDEYGISNECDKHIYQFKDKINFFMDQDEYFSNIEQDKRIPLVEKYSYNLMGGSEYYSCRVCESCELYEVEEDIYLNKIK